MPDVTPRPLAELTTLRVGGTPRRLVEVTSRDEAIDVLREVWGSGDDWLVLGGGSNLFVGDDDLDMTVVRLRNEGITVVGSPEPGVVRVRVEAGHEWDVFVGWTVSAGLAGVEGLSGIPGTVGAAPVQNIGAYGQEVVQTLHEVELIDANTWDVVTAPAARLGLGFRTSVLKSHYGSVADYHAVILSATFDLRAVGTEPVAVAGEQLRQALRLDDDARISLADIRATVLETRASKGMVLNDADPDTYSAGSFFQNAILPESFVRTLPEECPRWLMPGVAEVADRVIPLGQYDGYVRPVVHAERTFKVSAAWLIEHVGIRKGFRFPGSNAGLSTKHALALTNRGTARAEELAELARFIRGRVHSEYGLLLEPEPILVGVDI
ncbi:UDP-N-acetylmuramate dehydrogenase [Microbacterium sp. YY-03]|uniref:UDP-N-acetylmuramate dehydrogenase n=1 Tax=Microbacterium sp. YY-03 TaxID=3421636 RepID=UPI003D17E7D5